MARKIYTCNREGCDQARNKDNRYCSRECRIANTDYGRLIDQVRDMYVNRNMTDKEIGDKLGKADITIYGYRKRAGIASDFKSRSLDKEFDPVRIRSLWQETIQKNPTGRTEGSAAKVASQLNIDVRKCQRWLEMCGIKTERPTYANTIDSIGPAYDSGLTLWKVAEIHNLDVESVSKWIRQSGRTIRTSYQTSNLELDIQKEIESLTGLELKKSREVIAPKEIDLYSSKSRIGIEVNGTWYHCEKFKDKFYHRDKSARATEAGVFLYHIWEHEWRDERKREAILSQLQNLFGKNTRSVGARKTVVLPVSVSDRRDFLNKYHIQSADSASVAYGLYLDEELVSLMSFCKPRFSKKYEWELSRFASKSGMNVSGGASRLFKRFTEDHAPSSIVSYSDVAKTRGRLYESLGFQLSHQSSPNYIWTNGVEVLTRYQTQMSDEVNKMEQSGFYRVFDCGNKVWVWNS